MIDETGIPYLNFPLSKLLIEDSIEWVSKYGISECERLISNRKGHALPDHVVMFVGIAIAVMCYEGISYSRLRDLLYIYLEGDNA